MRLDPKSFIHPQDAKALRALEAIPGLKTLLAAYMKVYDERNWRGLLMSSCIRLNERQLPDLYSLFSDVFHTLGMEDGVLPECYLQMDPNPNAYTVGNTNTCIVLHSGIVELLSREELKAVIAHECGHILCKHMLYHTLARNIAQFGVNFLGLEILVKPVIWALLYWDRCSEFSADRVAAYAMGSADVVSDTMIRLSGGPKSITGAVDVDEYYRQVEELHKWISEDKYQALLQIQMNLYNNHPFCAMRSKEIRDWYDDPATILPAKNESEDLSF